MAKNTKAEAYRRSQPWAKTAKAKVLEHIRSVGACTDEEGWKATGMRQTTWIPRRNELVAEGHVKDTGERRRTSSGSQAAVWGAINTASQWPTYTCRDCKWEGSEVKVLHTADGCRCLRCGGPCDRTSGSEQGVLL